MWPAIVFIGFAMVWWWACLPMLLGSVAGGWLGAGLGKRLRWFIPQATAADFDCGEDRPVDPYLLGLILGDGNVTTSSLNFCSAD